MLHKNLILAIFFFALLVSCNQPSNDLPGHEIVRNETKNNRQFIVIESNQLNDSNIIRLNDFYYNKYSSTENISIAYFLPKTYEEYYKASDVSKSSLFKNWLYNFQYIKREGAVKSLSKNLAGEWKTIKDYQ